MKITTRNPLKAVLALLLTLATFTLANTPQGSDPEAYPWGMPVSFETGPDGLPLSTALELLAHSVNLTPVFEGIPDVIVTYNIPGHRPFGQLWVLITNLHDLDSLLLDGGIIVVAPEGSLEALTPSEPDTSATSDPASAEEETPVTEVPYKHEFYPLPASAATLLSALEAAYPLASATILTDAESLLVTAPEHQLPNISRFIDDYRTRVGLAQLDKPQPDTSPLATAYYPGGADLEALTTFLAQQYPEARITPMPESNLIAVNTTANNHSLIADQLNRLNTARFNHAEHRTRAYHQINHSDPNTLLESIRNALAADHEDIEHLITLDSTTRTIVLNGTDSFIADARHILNRLDRELPQVNIEVRFQEVTTRATEQLGINLASSVGLLALNLGSQGLNFLLSPASQGINSLNIKATLDLLEEQNLSKNIQDTHLTVTSGQTGTFNSGGRIDLVLTTADEDNQVQTIEYGTLLNITPFVTEDNKIRLDINAGVSGFQGELSSVSGIQLTNRDLNTIVTTEDGQALVIAGLLENTVDVVTTGVPVLKDLPIIGTLFRSTTNTENTSDVMIVIKAEIIHPSTATARSTP